MRKVCDCCRALAGCACPADRCWHCGQCPTHCDCKHFQSCDCQYDGDTVDTRGCSVHGN